MDDFRKWIETESPGTLEDKLAQMVKRTAILDVNMIKLARKYQVLYEEHEETQKNYREVDVQYQEREKDMKVKISQLSAWKR